MVKTSDVHGDMVVLGSNGRKIGKVVSCNDIGFQIETGMFFHKEYFTTYNHVAKINGNELQLDCGLESLQETEEFGGHGGDPLGTSFIHGQGQNSEPEDPSEKRVG